MATNKTPTLNAILPRADAIYPKLNTPDTKFDSDGVFETKLGFVVAEAIDGVIGTKNVTLADILARAEKLRDEFAEAKREELAAGDGKQKKKAKELAVREIGEAELDDATGEETGRLIIKAKMKASGISQKTGEPWSRKPKLFDAKGKDLGKNPPSIYGGSVLKVAVQFVPYYTPKDNEVGVSIRLEAVQVIELVSGGGRSASAYGFGAEEGYTGEDIGDTAGEVDDSAADSQPEGDEDF
ncbi:hypothetical protein [Stenotrophomonas maltophilia]|uniref:hypothetical protein n=1 Tax=Stenotrophomonas maltophilia TaxID=40324 RepID=UPI002091CC7F|nr:hypothetical protein [Stenotrophomonas maltophilia]MCO5735948.1 hypothetical protein [Stenotrophomonas maltophilia]